MKMGEFANQAVTALYAPAQLKVRQRIFLSGLFGIGKDIEIILWI